MCVIASIPAGQNVSEEDIREMWDRNSDGGGISYIDQGKVKVYKSMKLKPYLKKIKTVVKNFGDNDILLHMRIATHGEVCIANTHPFAVKQQGKALPNVVFAHNGILPSAYQTGIKDIDKEGIQISDTRQFNELFWNNFDIYSIDDARVRELIEDILGWGNKFVVFNADKLLRKTTYIFNEARGAWKNGIWLSNTHHCSISYSNDRKNWWDEEVEENDSKILTAINQSDPEDGEKTLVKLEKAQDKLSVGGPWGYDEGLYDPRLLNDSDWVEQLNKLLEDTGYQTLEDAMDSMWFEFDYDGEVVCPSCGNKLDSENNWARTCHEECDMFDYKDPGSLDVYESQAVALAEMQEQRVAEEQYANKISGHEVTLDADGQLHLF